MRYLDFKVGRNKYALPYLTNKEIDGLSHKVVKFMTFEFEGQLELS